MSVRIGTRASKLALMQTELVAGRLQGIDPTLDVEVVKITTGGDKNRSVPIVNLGGTGVFVKELEDALMNKEVDLVVHSLKD
ncbi:MAG TPA: hydroxymethylbilane synthase, partial [Candidatus Melainabacteria bacterium]|nr:hydroxymethylbilane synthase [Candidatus Melainabacteria bacterium]